MNNTKKESIIIGGVSFTNEQYDELAKLISRTNYHAEIHRDDSVPNNDSLRDCVAMMGYFEKNIYTNAPRLKWYQTASSGVDWINPHLRGDVTLTNASGAYGVSITEHMLAVTLSLLRNVHKYVRNQEQHTWRQEKSIGLINGSTVTVVGFGNIGRTFARYVKALGATVRAVARHKPEPCAYADDCYATDEIDAALDGADIVALCLPGTNETRRIISSERINSLKLNTIIVNVGRGSVIDEAALVDALKDKRIAGAALDVFESEPLPRDNPLWELNNTILTPHVSGRDADLDNSNRIYHIFYENIERFSAGKMLNNVVNRRLGY